MSKSLTDRKFRTQSQTASRHQLEDYLIRVVRQLEKYQVEKIKAKLLPPPGLFKLDLNFFNRKEEELEKLLKKTESERTLAAEMGQFLLKKNEQLIKEINILAEQLKGKEENISSLSSELQAEISNKEAAAQLGLELVQQNEELKSQVNAQQLKGKVSTKDIANLNNNILNYEKQKVN
jgi:hypothetical protein